MKAVLKTHIVVLALALPLQTLHGMNQVRQLTSKRSFLIFGGAASALLAYVGYKKWQQQLEDKKPITVREVTKELDKDVQTFLELLFIFNQKNEFQKLYDKTSTLYQYYGPFIEKYRTGFLWNRSIESLPPVQHLIRQLNSLRPLDNEGPLLETKEDIISIAMLIHDFIKNYIDREDTALNTFWSYILQKRISSPNPVSDTKAEEMILNLINYLKNFKNDISALYKLVERTSSTGIKEDLFDTIKEDLFIKKFIDKKTKQFSYDGQQFIDEIKTQIKRTNTNATLIDSIAEIYLPDTYKVYIKSPVKKGKQESMED